MQIDKERRRGGLGKIERRRLLEQLELLCLSGAGFEAIAPFACDIFRQLVGADSGSVFWQDEHGQPMGYYHDCAPAEIKDFFVVNFDALFSNPDEMNMVGMMRPVPPNIGKALEPGWREKYLASNVYKYLSGPLGHEHMLDARVDLNGFGRVLLCGWSGAGKPFTRKDADEARLVHDLVLRALCDGPQDVAWRSIGTRTAHFTTDIEGMRLLAIDDEAETWLRKAHLLRQNIPMDGTIEEAPLFVRQLAASLRTEPAAEMSLPVAYGRLAIRAVRSSLRGRSNEAAQIFVSLDMQQAEVVSMIAHLCRFPLTMLQKQIALYAMQGGARQDCESVLGVGPEGLKKHLNTIYGILGIGGWGGFASLAEMLARTDFSPVT